MLPFAQSPCLDLKFAFGLLSWLLLCISWGCSSKPSTYGFHTVSKLAHDSRAYTQGLLVQDGAFFESTGQLGQSSLRKLNLQNGEVERQIRLPDEDFGEGLAYLDGLLYQITWKNQRAYIYDAVTLAKLRELPYQGEGWGLTSDGKLLIMSDGSDNLTWRDPKTFKAVKQLRVHDGKQAVGLLNELEYIDGEIWANIYQSKRVARISPESGAVLSWIDFSGLPQPEDYYGGEDVLNGIAHDPKTGKLYITGKLYRAIYQVEIIRK